MNALPQELRYLHVWERLLHAPLVLRPEKAEIIARVLYSRERGAPITVNMPESIDLPDDPADTGYYVKDGIAIVNISGTLVHKLGGVRPYSGMIGYDSIRKIYGTALSDDEAKGILLVIDSPGGEGAGCFDLVDAMYDERGTKPVWACCDEIACSGGYALASVADRIMVPRTGMVGSIGVVVMHVDFSAALAKEGMNVTFIQYGERKTDGAPQIPLSKSAAARVQAQVDQMGDLFVETMARNRGVDPAKIKAQEADVYSGQRAIAAGLADAVMAKDEVFAEFHEFLFPKNQRRQS
jgi:signal peptide peptidase SppA